jgi:hypothetical protein
LQPIIKNTSDSIRSWSYSELFKLTSDSSDGKAIRNRDYKLIRLDYGAEEFYNLTLDPNETINLLNGNLTATDISNYHFLCDSITALTGVGTCKPLPINNISQQNEIQVYPNPFTNHIYLSSKNKNELCQLISLMGEIIYTGKEIEKQNFSNLPKGIYYLKINSNFNTQCKMVKQ